MHLLRTHEMDQCSVRCTIRMKWRWWETMLKELTERAQMKSNDRHKSRQLEWTLMRIIPHFYHQEFSTPSHWEKIFRKRTRISTVAKWHLSCSSFATETQLSVTRAMWGLGVVAHACNPSTLRGRGRRITWGQEFKTSLRNMMKSHLYYKYKN